MIKSNQCYIFSVNETSTQKFLVTVTLVLATTSLPMVATLFLEYSYAMIFLFFFGHRICGNSWELFRATQVNVTNFTAI